eukprot:GFKZ01001832.1.p1 GENE.GFKZ01001832.1~~GFKZ01001832.1.p1  ORF type:complete len:1380 (-),score=213.01 GFKZ01001832.1:655-4794(-)
MASSSDTTTAAFTQMPAPPLVADMPDCLPNAVTLPPVQYTIQVSTADARWSGTTKPVDIILFGDLAETDFIPLRQDHDTDVQAALRYTTPDKFNSATSSTEFPTGSVREFRFTTVPVGNLIKIVIRHDPANDVSAAWKLDRVVVRNEELQRSWTFLASRWLCSDHGNSVELKPLGEVAAGRRASRRASRRISTSKNNRLPPADVSVGAERFASMRDRFGNEEPQDDEAAISKGCESGTRRVCFQLQKFTNSSCHVYLLGGIPALGSWQPERALRMTTHSGADGTWRGEWRLEVEIDDDFDDIQYRYMIVNEKDPKQNRRVDFPDRLRRFKLSAPDSLGRSTEGGRVHVRDSFGANKFGLPSSSTHSLILRKVLSRQEPMVSTHGDLAIHGSLGQDRTMGTFSSPSRARLHGAVQSNVDAASDAPEDENEDHDAEPDNASEEQNGQSETDLCPSEKPPSCDSAQNGESVIDFVPEIELGGVQTESSIAEARDKENVTVSQKDVIRRDEEAARREWEEQLDASDGQLYKSAQSLVRRQSEILYLKKRNSKDVNGSPILLPPTPESPEKSSPISSDGALEDESFTRGEPSPRNFELAYSEMTRPLLEENEKLQTEIGNLKQERDKNIKLYRQISEAHDSLQDDLKTVSEKMASRCEEYESQHAELVKLVVDSQEAFNSAREEVLAEKDEIYTRWAKEFKARRKLFNTIQELRGNIRVFCRVRPLKQQILSDGSEACIAMEFPDASVGEDSRISIGSKVFEYDHVFQPASSQTMVYEETSGVVASVLDGYNVCVFAYGQTGSGKTHTMNGPEDDRGVNYRALVDLFEIAEQRSDFQKVNISVSMLEIYNENLRDLIREDDGTLAPKLDIRRDPNSSSQTAVHVPNLTAVAVESVDHVWEVMERGSTNRSKGKTNMNEHSSRSHLIFKVAVACEDFSSGVKTCGILHLVDLAGSERVGRSNVSGDRLKEAQHINKSLATLGDVFMALLSNSGHVPYRNSKLTYLLQDCLGGDSKTLMFVNVSSDVADSSETLSSLQFAQRVAKVELGAAKKHTERTAETKAIAALQAKETQAQELTGKVSILQRELRKKDESYKTLESEVKSLKAKLEEQSRRETTGRQGTAQELKELRALVEKSHADLRGVKQKARETAQTKDDDIGRLNALLRSKDRKIAELSRGASRRTGDGPPTRITRPVSTPNISSRRPDRTPSTRLPRNATYAGRSRQVRFEESQPTVAPERSQENSDEVESTSSADDSSSIPPPTPMSGARRVKDGAVPKSQTIASTRLQRQSSRNVPVPGASRPAPAFGKRMSTQSQDNGPVRPARNVRLPRASTTLRPAKRVSQIANGRSTQPSLASGGRPPSAPRRAGTSIGVSSVAVERKESK